MSKRVKVSIDAFGEWVFRDTATKARGPVNPISSEATPNESHTHTDSAVELSAHRDHAYAYGFASSDPHLDDRTTNCHDNPQRDDTDLAAHLDICPSVQDHSQHSSVASIPAKQRKPKSRRTPRQESTNAAQHQDKYPHSEDQSQQSRAVMVPAKRKPPKPRVPAMLKALFPHNDGPPIAINPTVGLQTPPEDSDGEQRRMPVTRTLFQGHCKRLRNEPEAPRKSLNVRSMMRTQLQGKVAMKGEKSAIGSPASSKFQSSPDRSRSVTLRPVSISGNIPISGLVEDFDVSLSWKCWEDKKEELNKLFGLAQDLPELETKTLRLGVFNRFPSSRHVDFGFDEDGIYIFRPTAEQYSRDFTELLALMEKTAGHVQGVVKVIIPDDCISPHLENKSRPNVLVDVEIPIVSTTLSQCPSAKRSDLYIVDTKTVGPGPAKVTKILDRIQEEEAFILKDFGDTNLKDGSVWRQRHEESPFTEKSMLACIANAEDTNPWCALDAPATFELREALEFKNLHLGEDSSNGFLRSATVRAGTAAPGLGQSCFHLSIRSGTMFAMHLGDFAAYTLNYHHAGGPRSYTIIRPSSHRRLEEFICLAFQPSKNPKPPSCSQFVSHELMYVPKETLVANGIEFTEVTQFERELLVIFPYAYYQGFNGGANVVEEVMYASKKWEVFHREGLYVKCNKDCLEGEDEFDLSFAERRSDDDDDDSDDYDIRQPASKRRRLEE